jgi:glycosyltransferase involved in cell wall biosynthesis
MRITWLLETADQLWGGVKVALEDANWLHHHGHEVTVVSRSGPPAWMRVECGFRTVQDFRPDHLPDADVVVATYWTTLPWAASAGRGKGVPVHFCQGYEGDQAENAHVRDRIEASYRLPGVRHVTIAPHLTRLLRERFGTTPTEVVYAIDHTVHRPSAVQKPGRPLRVGLVGPYQISWKDLATGFEACRLAHLAGLPLVLVRATNSRPAAAEMDTPFPVEWHQQLPPQRMGEFYRSLDVFLGTSSGPEEGFFLPAIEAMANGVPTVLTDIPCFRGHGDGRGDDRFALFVPPRDPAAMAEALVVAGTMPEVRTTLRTEGIRLAARYHPDRHGEQLAAALAAFVAEARGATPALKVVTAAVEPADHATDDLLQRLGNAARGARSPHQCARFLAAACALAPDDMALWHRLADAHRDAGDHTAALAVYTHLASLGIDDESLHAGRGHALHALGRMADAAQAFRAALAVGTRTADAYNRLGVVLYQAGDTAGARQNFERALVLQPDHGDARANLAALPAA